MKKLVCAALLALLGMGPLVNTEERADWTGDLSPISAADWNHDLARHPLKREV